MGLFLSHNLFQLTIFQPEDHFLRCMPAVSRGYFPETGKASQRSLSTYWSCSLTVLSSTDDKALLESYFLFAEADTGETDEQGFRCDGSWVRFPAQPWTWNRTGGSKPNTLPSNLKPEGAITQRTLEPFRKICFRCLLFWKRPAPSTQLLV